MHFEVLQTKCCVDEASRENNMAFAMSRGLPLCTPQMASGKRLAICGSAPSIKEHLEELRSFDGDVWAVNGALNYLHDEGVKVSGWVGCDPLDFLNDYLKTPPEGVRYYVASICDPKTFESLKDRDVYLWHMAEKEKLITSSHVPGGTTVTTRAPYLGLLLGYRDITIYGADSSYGETTYVYGEERFAQPDTETVLVGERTFVSNGPLIHQAAQFSAMQEIWPRPYRTKEPATLHFKCGGLLGAFLAEPIQSLRDIEAHG